MTDSVKDYRLRKLRDRNKSHKPTPPNPDLLTRLSSRGKLSHPRVNETYSEVNGIFRVNKFLLCTEKKKLFNFLF